MASSSSLVTACIDYALHYMDSIVLYYTRVFQKQKYKLRTLKTFALLTGKFENDVRPGSLLRRIEDAVIRLSPVTLPNSLGSEDLHEQFEVYNLAERIRDFQRDLQSLKEGIDEWYVDKSDNTKQSDSLTAGEVGKIFESILENLEDLPGFSQNLAIAMETLQEHANFLKNFCRFATSRGVDIGQMKDFLTHTEAIAISAAHLCFLCGDDMEDEEWQKGMESKISKLVQKIKPIDPQVCETYAQVISCSKFSRRLDAPNRDMDVDSTIVMKNFIDSLIPILWDMLRLDTFHEVCLKDNWQLLYEGLRSLRTIMKNKLQPKDIDEKIKDDIGDMVCDAGIIVCLFYHKNGEIDLGLQDLWERIKGFLAEAGEEVPQTSTFNPSSINVQGFVGLLLENLMELTNGTVEPIVQSRVQPMEEGLRCLRTLLGEIEELLHEQEELQALWNRVLMVTYRVEFLIDHLIVANISDSFIMQFDSVIKDIQNIETVASKSSYIKRHNIKVEEVTSPSSHVPSQKMASITTDVVALKDEAMSIIYRLLRGSKELKVIAIVGMGGLGKTTLAAKVYQDPSVIYYFHVCAWCSVSQTLDKRSLLLELLKQICPENEKCFEMGEDDLAEKLKKQLKGKRFLIFLDDVWTTEAWNSLEALFPNDFIGSRIILTSRNHDVAMLDQEPLYLSELNKEDSLELLQRKLFPGKYWPLELDNLGMQIAEKCKGLPLTIVIVAGLLRTTEQEGWKEIVDGLSSGLVSSTEQCMNSMELSYKHLPDYLKPCFLYFGAFPEDQEVSVRRLIRLWIAEGFIQKSKLKSLEDAAEDYMKDLIGRSLIMVAKRGSMGGVKRCSIHDLLHDFCRGKAKGENFLHLVKGYDELLAFNEPCNLRRLCIHSAPQYLKESKLFCPRARSLLFFSPKRGRYETVSINIFLFHIFQFVSVLDLEGIDLGDMFPSEIELLVLLRYLAIRGSIRVIPSWVGNLSMLETLILYPCFEEVSLPATILNLQKLKYLRIVFSFGELPIENLDNSSVLYELDTFCGAFLTCGDVIEKQMRKFPNIRKLKCMVSCYMHEDDRKECQNIRVPDFLSGLESLNITQGRGPKDSDHFKLSFPTRLKKLTLKEFKLPWSEIATIAGLPNLEVLKLLDRAFQGETWEMKEGEFPKLKYLKLSGLDLVRWTASEDSDDQFPCLEKLVLVMCWNLEEMPSCLENSPTLETIEVKQCVKAISSVNRIREEQVNMGNLALQIVITNDLEDFEEGRG